LDKWNLQDLAADYVYIGQNKLDFEVPGTLGVICDFENWKTNYGKKKGFYPLLKREQLSEIERNQVAFCVLKAEEDIPSELSMYENLILVLDTNYSNKTQLFRNFFVQLAQKNLDLPVVLHLNSKETDAETFQLYVSSDAGSVLIDGFGDGIWISAEQPATLVNSTAFGILQATRTRISKTEYISCPSCGRTLFDLQETTAKIRERTSHLKGIKIGIMGCIVNGPGEMADADYGYVGTGPGKINLYKEKTVVRKNVPEDQAVQALIDLIQDHGDWVDVIH
jgi:(E)-4-hydroxy-3-methylbut-2-enyl-diphosphate synthase